MRARFSEEGRLTVYLLRHGPPGVGARPGGRAAPLRARRDDEVARRERGRQLAALLPVHARLSHHHAAARPPGRVRALRGERGASRWASPKEEESARGGSVGTVPGDARGPSGRRRADASALREGSLRGDLRGGARRPRRRRRGARGRVRVRRHGPGVPLVAAARCRAGAFHSVLPGLVGAGRRPRDADGRARRLRAARRGAGQQAGDAGSVMSPRGVAEHGPRRERRHGAAGRGVFRFCGGGPRPHRGRRRPGLC